MTIYDVALTLIPRVGSRTAAQLLEIAPDAQTLWGFSGDDLRARGVSQGMAEHLSVIFKDNTYLLKAAQIIEYCRQRSVRVLCRSDVGYSRLLSECPDAPHILYVRGELDFNAGRWVSVVGTRKATSSGLHDTEQLVTSLGAAYPDLVVVSGLAFGIDKAAHTSALNHNIPTVCVMPGWVENITPSTNYYVAKRILEQGGAVVSDMPHGTVVGRANFLSRNRIIAGLSMATFVVESAAKGGSLVTADIACSYDREVFAVPGRVGEAACEGTNNLIKCDKATMYQDVSDVAHLLGWAREIPAGMGKDPSALPDGLRRVFCAMLDTAPVTLDYMCEALEMPISHVSSSMIRLEKEGFIKSLPGRLYQKAKF